MYKYFQLILVTVVVMVSSASFAGDIYYCPMHPHYTSDKPGNCPICGMTLVKRAEANVDKKNKGIIDHAQVRLNESQQNTLGIVTVKAKKEPLHHIVRASGYVSTVNDVFVLQDAYVKAYIDYVTVFRDKKRFNNTRRNWESHREVQLKLHQAEENLLRLGFNTAEIEKLQKYSWNTPWEQPALMFDKDGVNYWVVAAIYEQDLGFLEVGQEVDIIVHAYREHLKGVVRTVGQIIDPQTRTVNALVEIQGYRGELVGNMFVNVEIHVELNEYVMVPKEAVMDTGTRQIVFIKDAFGVFSPKEVKAIEGDNGWGIIDGIKESDEVVAQGNFLLDSESRMQASLQGSGI